ncbi:MAG TPA: hypothetical protein VMJ10_15655 [Kofleriaceae bacterium]|nr:hypothetical protein [Kofleriaceae bacterium]
MRSSVAFALLACATPAVAGHFDDVIDPHAKGQWPPEECKPDPSDLVPRCPSRTQVADADDSPPRTRVADADDSPPPVEPGEIRAATVAALLQRHDSETPTVVLPAAAVPDRLVLDDSALRWQGEAAIGFGNAVVDGTSVSAWPSLNLGGGIASGRFAALATYTLTAEHYSASGATALSTTPAPAYEDTDGIVHRLGLAGRYSVLHGVSDIGLLGDMWLQGDGGEEFTRWDRGGLLERPYVGIGLGFQGGLASSAHKRHAMYVAVRVQIARRSDLDDALATCSAPCTEATPPERWSDRSIELRVGFAWGN